MLAGRCIFFYVYLYVCILLLEVYIQGCVFIYKNAYLKRMYKKEKCIHYVAHFFLPAAAGRILKMYTHACTHKKPSQRAGHISKNAYICRHIFSVVLCIHMHTLFFFSPSFKHPLQFHQDKEQKGNRRTKENRKKYKNKRICRNKKNVFVNRGFPRTSIKNKRKIKKSKW